MKVLNEYNNLVKNVRRNNFIVLSLVVLMGFMVLIFAVYSYKIAAYFSNNQYILESTGEVRHMKHISPLEAREIEAKDHMSRFYGTFYTFDQFNMDKQLNMGFWLGDESLRSIYEQYKNGFFTQNKDSWYNNIIQFNISQTTEPTEINVDLSVYPYRVSIKGIMYLNAKDKTQKYSLNGTCLLENVNRDYPKNPHGLFIRNWTQEPLKVIQ